MILSDTQIDRPAAVTCDGWPDNVVVTATDSKSGREPDNITTPRQDLVWQPADIVGAKEILIDYQGLVSLNTLVMLCKAFNGVTLEIRASIDNFVGSDVEVLAAGVVDTPNNILMVDISDSVASFQQLKFRFTTFSSSFLVQFIAVDNIINLPYLETDSDPASIEVEGDILMSKRTLAFLGGTKLSEKKSLPLNFGAVDIGSDADAVSRLAEETVEKFLPFFWIPDTGKENVAFGVFSQKKFNIPIISGTPTRRASRLTMITKGFYRG